MHNHKNKKKIGLGNAYTTQRGVVTCFAAWATRLATFDAVIVHSVAAPDMSVNRLLGKLQDILRSSAACVAFEMFPFCINIVKYVVTTS